MKRRFLNAAIWSLLLLCAGVSATGLTAIAATHRWMVSFDANTERHGFCAYVDRPGLCLRYSRLISGDPWRASVDMHAYNWSSMSGPPRNPEDLAVLYRPHVEASDRVLGFGFTPDHDGGYVHRWNLLLPYPAIALVFSIPPALWFIARLRRRYSRSVSLCASCGYNLRASKGGCPECGAAIPAESPTHPLKL
ncbi:MAG: hypothetical protein K8S99_04440 [Planctomycetes bacterium]|nr:hypothetical protein [Planctomycetota bacterium]